MSVAIGAGGLAAPGTLAGPSPADRAWARATLPRVSRTFAINIRLLAGSMAEAVRVAYLLCRIADTIEDAWPGDRREIEARFDALIAAVAGDAAAAASLAAAADVLSGRASVDHVSLVRHASAALRCFAGLPAEDRADVARAVTALASGMRRYAGRAAERDARGTAPAGGRAAAGAAPPAVSYLDDEAELADYCWIVAGCVGEMLTALFTRRAAWRGERGRFAAARRVQLAPRVGEGLQLTNILLDWPADVRGGRCHVPASWLAEFGLTPADLVGAPKPGIAELAARLEQRARDALAVVPEYLATIPSRHVRYRMFCLWPALWALASLRCARAAPDFPWGPTRPRVPRSELWNIALATLPLGHSRAGVAALARR